MPLRVRRLLFLGNLFQWLSRVCLLGIILLVPGLILALLGYLPWPFLILFLGFPGYLIFDTISSLFGFFLFESLKTHATIDEVGVHATTPDDSFLLDWSQIARIRCTLARPFPPVDIRFRSEISFEFILHDGESVWVDALASLQLRELATEHGIILENFPELPPPPPVPPPPIYPPISEPR